MPACMCVVHVWVWVCIFMYIVVCMYPFVHVFVMTGRAHAYFVAAMSYWQQQMDRNVKSLLAHELLVCLTLVRMWSTFAG